MLSEFAPAKVNLFLHVGPVKPNGRHDLDSLVVFAKDAGDWVSASPAERVSLDVTGPHATVEALGKPEDNLVLKAAIALADATGETRGAALTLEKHLPIAAGIGGGSADAAAALRVLTKIWGTGADTAKALAPQLGGDVPVALEGRTARMRGEGERVEAVHLPAAIPALLVNPGVACPTGDVFRAFDAAGGGEGYREMKWPVFPEGEEGRLALMNWLSAQSNDLEAVAIGLQPVIANVLEWLDTHAGAWLTRMSGSGATCFALFETIDAAEAAERAARDQHPDWWARATLLGDGM